MKRNFTLILVLGLLLLGAFYPFFRVLAGGDNSNTLFGIYLPRHYDPEYFQYTKPYYIHLDSGVAWDGAADSNRIACTHYTDWRFLGREISGFQYILRAWQIDTTYDLNDNCSLSVVIQVSQNPNTDMPSGIGIFDIFSCSVLEGDTGSCFYWCPAESASAHTLAPWVRSKITYTAWQDSTSAVDCDTLSHVSDIRIEESIFPLKD